MSTAAAHPSENGASPQGPGLNPPTFASFSPVTLGRPSSSARQRSTILVHQKSPLLVATPPQITRALAYSYPFLLPLNRFAGLLSWTTGDPWESFLLLAGFWAVVLYGDLVIQFSGPIIIVLSLMLGMYSRRYSPLSSTGLTGEKAKRGHKRDDSDGNTRHYKSLDEIVETLRVFTSRCNVLLDPFIQLTEFLSTQRTATSATTRPALTTLFLRILLLTPLWIALTLPPFYIITTRRVVLTTGTLTLSWHSRPARAARAIIWRSLLIRRLCSIITGLDFTGATRGNSSLKHNGVAHKAPPRVKTANELSALAVAKGSSDSSGVHFTFILFENQRRWIGLGWTSSLLTYERAPWTDEYLNPTPPKEQFQLPEVEGGHAKWRWAEGSEWQVEGAGDRKDDDSDGWIYYDNKWHDGRRGQDGWGRYTRRRKWYRDAELVETSPGDNSNEPASKVPSQASKGAESASEDGKGSNEILMDANPAQKGDDGTIESRSRKKGWFRRSSKGSTTSDGKAASGASVALSDTNEDDHHDIHQEPTREVDWGVGDDARMGLG
ncbi:Pex24p-domain-containing protein [Xylona heveae TC161]|uniref:Pex24p-domain-containing protein n=1 Tax=Xylona heveae (strain CBS 132557 / TC161) TaxID=1328760 RepID=A0A165H1Y3_XYLHT|nr:Pex24p-domain-containing protein [Xylona heveae TC161]KZF22880.1 Pex24p-domain-containing protein [Xylona heveae TC161]